MSREDALALVHGAVSLRPWSERHASTLLMAVGVLVTVLCVLAIHWNTRLFLVAIGALIIAIAFLKPRVGLLLVFAFPLLFREETWQLSYWPAEFGGTQAAVATAYSRAWFGMSIAGALIGVLVLRSVLGRSDRDVPHPRTMEVWLVFLLAAAAFAEIIGRLATGYQGSWLGQWTQIALPIAVALVIPVWCAERDLRRGIDVLLVIAAGRLAFGLARYATGGGDYNMGVAKRAVFWDSADGAISVVVVAFGISWLLDPRAGRVRKTAGALLVCAGLVVIALSYRRQAMIAVAVAVAVTLLVLHHARTLLWVLAAAAVILGIVLAVQPTLVTQSSVGLRVASVVVRTGPLASTNEWHLADLKDGILNVAQSPVLGYGFHTSPPRRVYALTSRDTSLEVIGVYHNLVLNAWFRMGLAGLIALSGVVWIGLRSGARRAWGRRCPLSAALTGAVAGIVAGGASAPILVSDRLPYVLFGGLVALAMLALPDDRGTEEL